MAKVKTLESSRDFLALVEKSGLLSGDQLESARQACGATEDAKAAARQILKDGLLTNWQVNQLLAGFAALVTGNYKLLDQIGKGELGKVYLAEHMTMHHRVALKTLASKSTGDPKIVERFVAEARAASEFEHRNILRVLAVSGEGDRPFVATEFIAGGDLQQRVDKSGPMSPRDAAEFIAQAAEGLAYVHGKNVIHRDLKPANLMIDDHGVVKILDVGVGQLRQAAKPGNESTGEILMSALGYMSPEQVRGKEMDNRSDIYALGGTLYFLLSGRMPYTAVNDEERDLIRKTKRPVPVATIKPDVPANLAKLVDQAMALRPAERPASMADFAKSLRAIAESLAANANANAKTVSASTTLDAVDPVATESLSATFEFDKQPAFDSLPVEESPEPTQAKPSSATTVVSDTTAMLAAIGSAAADPGTANLPSGFKIQKKKKEVISQAMAAAPDALGEKVVSDVLKRAKRHKILVIATGAISVAIMIISIVVYSVFGVSSSSPAVAAAGDSAAPPGDPATDAASPAGPSAAKPKDEPTADPNDPENTPDPEVAVPVAAAPTATAPVAATPAPATPPAAPVAAGPAVPSPVAASPPAASPPPANPAPTAPANPATAAAAPAAPPVPATTPMPMPATPAVSPAAPPPTDTKKEPTPATPPAVQPKPPTPAPPKAPPSGKTFEIANAVELPRLPSADGSTPAEAPAKVLGRVNIDPKDTCFMAMIGGERAMKGKNTFAIRNAQGGVALRDWEITQKGSTEEIVIATMTLPANELKFEWTPDGLKNAAAPFLKNCAIKITAGQDKPHIVAFRRAVVSVPTKLENLEKATLSAKFALDSLPDNSSLRMEVSIPGQKTLFDAGGGGDITKADQWIFFGENKEQAPLALKLDTSALPKGITVTLAPFVLMPGEKPAKLTAATRKRFSVDAMKSAKTQLDGVIKQMETSKEKEKLQNEIAQRRMARDSLDKTIAQVDRLLGLLPQLESGGKVHFRIYYDATDSSGSTAAQIELVKTDDNAPAK